MIITLDIWDTALRRRHHPDATKDAVSRHILLQHSGNIHPNLRTIAALTKLRQSCEHSIGSETASKGFDDEYEIRDVFRRLLKQALITQPLDADPEVEKIVQYEIQHECLITYPDPEIRSFLSRYPNAKIFGVSDFYMKWSDLAIIIKKNGLDDLIADGITSAEISLNKRSGKIFSQIAPHTLGSPWIHVGDNPISDVEIPSALGAQAIHYQPEIEHAARLLKESIYRSGRKQQINQLQNQALAGTSPNALFLAGRASALPLSGYLLHIYETTITQGAQSVWFFTREGLFIKEAFERLFTSALPLVTPPAHLVKVSRIATFCASLKECSISELMRLWTQYSRQSIKAMLVSCNIEQTSDILDIVKSHGIDAHETITYPWQNQRVIRLFDDPAFKAIFNAKIQESRDLLREYLAPFIPNQPNSKVVIVDIGWRGTIQDNIARIFPETQFIGCYFGLNTFLNAQEGNTIKMPYGPNINLASQDFDLLKFVSPLEMLFNNPHGSTQRYVRKPVGVVPITTQDPEEDRVYYAHIEHFQQGILAGITNIGPSLHGSGTSADYLRQTFLDWWRNVIERPDRDIAKAFLELNHNETFGVGEFVRKSMDISFIKSILFPFVPAWNAEVKRTINKIGWEHLLESSENPYKNIRRALKIKKGMSHISLNK